MAMDGVEGQARAGWTHDKILDLFYPGTTPARAGGVIRVGLANEPVVTLSFPHGGVVSNAPRGSAPGAGFPTTLAAGARITVRRAANGVALDVPDAKPAPKPAASRPTPSPNAVRRPLGAAVPELIPQTPPPIGEPTPTPAPKKPAATPRPAPATAPSGGDALQRVFVWGTGDPALVSVAATGRRYRGSIEVVPHGGALNVVNHVDLETYVAGIAEEKGAGWPSRRSRSSRSPRARSARRR